MAMQAMKMMTKKRNMKNKLIKSMKENAPTKKIKSMKEKAPTKKIKSMKEKAPTKENAPRTIRFFSVDVWRTFARRHYSPESSRAWKAAFRASR